MMHKDISANGHIYCRTGRPYSGNCNAQSSRRRETESVSLPIPAQKSMHRQSVNESDDSNDSSSGDLTTTTDTSPFTAFSRSLSGPNPASPLNVYSMSPRNTSVMYQYYSRPKEFFQNQNPSLHPSRSDGRYCTDEHAKTRQRHRSFGRANSECCESPPKSPSVIMAGLPQTVQSDIIEDPRRRAWSESDSNRKNSIHLNRMSALRKLRRKLGRSGSLKKRKDDINHNDYNSHSGASISSLEKVEEGRQLGYSQDVSPNSSRPSTMVEEIADLSALSLHQEDETGKTNDFSPDRGSKDRVRSPSSESVFSHDPELIYQRFLEEHTCYDIMPTSCKLVVFDTRLQARKAFHALVANSVRSAPLWDSEICCYVGMLTVTDFIRVILTTHRTPNMRVDSVEEQTIESWRMLLNQQLSFASVHPADTLLASLKILINEHFHGVPIMDEVSGDIFHIINYKRILRFLHLFMNELPRPTFMNKTLREVKIGTYEQVATVTKQATMLQVLELLISRKLTAIPVVDADGEVVDVFCKLDMISLAAQELYHDLSMTMEMALAYRFTPLFEDEECQADAFSRFSSPPMERRSLSQIRDDSPAPLSDIINNPKRRSESNSTKSGNSAIKGHTVVRAKPQKSPEPQWNAEMKPPPPVSSPQAPSVIPECTGHHRARHKSLSNPLVKCRLSDKLQHVIDLMVITDANLLVVVEQMSSHVIGVVTVSDVLSYLVNPLGRSLDKESPTYIHKRSSRHRYSSHSSTTFSLPSVQDEVESALEEDASAFGSDAYRSGPHLLKQSSSSDASTYASNDSGYTSSLTMLGKKDSDSSDPSSILVQDSHREKAFSSRNEQNYVNTRFLRRGVEMERA